MACRAAATQKGKREDFMYTGGCTKSGEVYILLPEISADIKICLCMPGARCAPSTLPAIMNEVL